LGAPTRREIGRRLCDQLGKTGDRKFLRISEKKKRRKTKAKGEGTNYVQNVLRTKGGKRKKQR